jgi:succinyl-diaminopimelate desuccinylase
MEDLTIQSRNCDLAGSGERLAARTVELIDISSPSRSEVEIAIYIRGLLEAADVPVSPLGETSFLVGAAARRTRPLVLLVGHLDTVPAQGNLPGRLRGGDVFGLGASDMKGGLAVMLELALAGRRRPVDVGYLLFGREEVSAAESELRPLLESHPELGAADLAIVLEPTDNRVQAGCLGNLDAVWTFRGREGHSARPWLADNAIDHAVSGLSALREIQPQRHTVRGLEFTRVVSATAVQSGVAGNVIPGLATARVNFRYPPDLSPAEAEAAVRVWCEPHGEVEVVGNSHGALPPSDSPLLGRLLEAAGESLEPKQAWTPVAELAAAGIEAVNFGPGDPAYAHSREERVSVAALARSYAVLESFLCG